MGRPPGTLRLPLAVCMALLFWLPTAASNESSEHSEYLIQVVSAKYLVDRNIIQYKLVNTGNNPVTAFSAEISAEAADRDVIRNGGPVDWNRDLLYGELFLQCRNVPENAGDEDANPFPDSIRVKGTIKPGQSYIVELPGDLLDKDLLQHASPTIHVVITGIVWSDGTMEGTKEGIAEMQRFRDLRHEAGVESDEVLTVLTAHIDDDDAQRRINETITDLRALLVGYPREVEAPEDEPGGNLYVHTQSKAEDMITDLEQAAFLPNPQERYQFLFEFAACARDRAKEIQQVKPVVPLKSRR